MSKTDAIQQRIQRLATFSDVQKELGFVIAEIERQSEACRDARADRDLRKSEYESREASESIGLRAEMPGESAKYIEHHATLRCAEQEAVYLSAEREYRKAESRMDVLRDYLKAMEILCNNMRAELRNLNGQQFQR